MISRIEGTILKTTDKFVVLDVHGIGFKIYTTNDVLLFTKDQKTLVLFTFLSVKEDALDLYGFRDEEELGFFELLLSVSGIGPKSAIGIMNIATIDSLKKAIATGDTNYLTKISGIGRKTAEKIVIELRDKLSAHTKDAGTLKGESDAVEALKALGYSLSEARDALKNISAEDIGEKIKEALKILGKK